MKKKMIILCVILLIIAAIPHVGRYNDGGSVSYASLLYNVTDYNSILGENEYLVGRKIKIFGITIFDNTQVVKECTD